MLAFSPGYHLFSLQCDRNIRGFYKDVGIIGDFEQPQPVPCGQICCEGKLSRLFRLLQYHVSKVSMRLRSIAFIVPDIIPQAYIKKCLVLFENMAFLALRCIPMHLLISFKIDSVLAMLKSRQMKSSTYYLKLKRTRKFQLPYKYKCIF